MSTNNDLLDEKEYRAYQWLAEHFHTAEEVWDNDSVEPQLPTDSDIREWLGADYESVCGHHAPEPQANDAPLHEKKENAVVLREPAQPEEREKALRKTLGLSKVVEAKSGREYKGKIVHVDREAGIAWMETGWKSGVLHQLRELDAMPKEGAAVITYGKDGAGGCVRQGPEVEKQVVKYLANERGR